MKIKTLLAVLLSLSFGSASAQTFGNSSMFDGAYKWWVDKASEAYNAKNYRQSAEAYTKAFAVNGDRARIDDRYNAACSWAQAGERDSAFRQLEMIGRGRYVNYNHLMIDPDLEPLRFDPRWPAICAVIKQNKEMREEGLNHALIDELDSIFRDDQQYRLRLGIMEAKFGRGSQELKIFWQSIAEKDSVNLLKVEAILEKYGWPGPRTISQQCSQAIFLVIQHADINTQEKYLPLMRAAVKDGKVSPGSLALLEDRINLARGRKQVYGSQIGMDKDGKYYVDDLEDPDNVDKRRAEVGLQPLSEYVKFWNLTWDVSTYKKEQAQRARMSKEH